VENGKSGIKYRYRRAYDFPLSLWRWKKVEEHTNILFHFRGEWKNLEKV
jgi:hypothetical protein